MSIRILAVSAGTLAAVFAITATAQTARADQSVVEEVIVTTKRGELISTQEMTEAVTAFSGESLERQFAVTLEDFNHYVPNVQLEHVGLFQAAASFSMRGIGTAGIESFADPVVAVFVDDAYYARNAVSLLDLFDIESVTVLRGPQGTLYGRNAFAGAISVRSKRPEIDEFVGEVHLDVGNHGRYNIGGVLNAPLVEDKLAMRVAAQYHNLDGFFRNDGVVVESYTPGNLVTTVDEDLRGDHVNGEESIYVRPSIRWTPNDQWRIDLIGEYWEDDGDGTSNWTQCYQPGSIPPPVGDGPSGIPDLHTIFGFPCKDPFGDDRFDIPGDGSDAFETNFGLVPNQTKQDIWGVTLDANYEIEAGTFTLIFNHRDVEEDITSDTDGFNYDVFSSSRVQDYEATQAELRFATTLGDDVDLLLGGFYLRDEYVVQQFLWIFVDSDLFGGGGFTRDNPFVSWGSNEQVRTSSAVYAQMDWHVTDKWTFNLGGRYTYEEKKDVLGMAINDSNCPPGETPQTAPCNGVPFSGNDPTDVTDVDPSVRFGPVDEDWNNFSPRVGVEYRVNEDAMLFGFWQRAFKSGGFVNNAGTLPVFESPYEPEQVDNFEIGMKSDWFDDRLRVNLSAFKATYKDLQRGVIRAAPTSTGQETFVDNAAGADSYGVEVSFSMVLVVGLTLYGVVGWLDIEYDEFTADITGDGVETDNSGLDLVRAPKWDMSFGASYAFPQTDFGVFSVAGNWSYTSRLALTTPNDVGFVRDSLDTLDLQANWESLNGKYRFSIWGKNVTDNYERLGGTPVATLFAFASPTQPRQYGATFVARLGD